jgi:hypothetical protein
MPTGGTSEQQQYFYDNFKMELEGAKYPVVTALDQSMYSLPLRISNNPYFGQPGEEEFVLTIVLNNTKDGNEVVRFEFPFTDLQKMYEWNLFLVYRTMGNAVSYYDYDAEGSPVDPDPKSDNEVLWRDKWLYAIGTVGIDSGHLILAGTNQLSMGIIMPVASVGAEFQFLNFMAAGLDIKLRLLTDGSSNALFTPALALWLKGVWKPGRVFMIEPYAGLEAAVSIGGSAPWLWGDAGVQLAFKSGARSSIVLDLGATVGLAGSLRFPGDKEYNALRFSASCGYKIGWFDRKKPAPAAPPETTEAPPANEAK